MKVASVMPAGEFAHLVFTLYTRLINFVVLPELLDLRLTLHRVGAHVEASLGQVDSVLVGTCMKDLTHKAWLQEPLS